MVNRRFRNCKFIIPRFFNTKYLYFMKKHLFTLCAIVFALVGCQTEVNILPADLEFDAPDFYAEIADQTRAQLNDSNRVLWNDTDVITIFKRTDHNLKYEATELSESRTNCTFSYTREYVRHTGAKFDFYYSVYPFREDNTISADVISMSMPSIQTYEAGNEFKHVPMVAKSYTLNIVFDAPTSVMRVKLSKVDDPNDYLLKSITVTSASQNLAGMVDIDMTQDVFKAVVNPDAGVASKSVMLDFEDGVALTTDIQSFFLPIPYVTVSENDLLITCEVEVSGKTYFVERPIAAAVTFDPCTIKAVTVPSINAEEFVGSTEDQIGGDITEGLTPEDDGSFVCPITEDMILTEPLYLPQGATATISLSNGATLSNSAANPNSALIAVEEGADLTIEGDGALSTIVASAAQASALSATRAASNTAFPIVVNGTLRIKGGCFTLNSYATSWLNCGIYVGPKGKLIIEDGRFHSPKGSFIFGHEHGNRPEIIIQGGRFEGYDPSDNDFDGNGSNYLEPEYASYYVAENELVVAERTAEWEVDNNYLLKSIIENGGTAHLVVPEEGYYELTESMSVNYPVTLDISNSADAQCCIYFDGNDTMFRCYSDLTIGSPITFGQIDSSYEMPKVPLFYLEAVSDIATVYEGGSLTVNNGEYFGGTDGVTTSLFNSRGGDITINNGAFSLDVIESNTITVEGEGQVIIYDGDFYNNFDPANVDVNGEIKSLVAPERYSVALLEGGYGVKKKGTFTAASYNVDGLPSLINSDGPGSKGTTTLGNRINGENWDIVTFQENFEYRSNLYNAITNYTIGTDKGGLNYGSALVGGVSKTDGLGFATLSSTTSFSGETLVKFNSAYGGLFDGANTCIEKGFRYYCVTLSGGANIDVYVTHMNSGNNQGHKDARASQFQQLAQYIASNNCGNPVLVLGDFNARYTRDNIQANFHNNLGAFAKYLSDAWVELVDKYDINGNLLYAAGEYPDYPSDSLVVTEKYEGAEGDIHCTTQGGEVVDKIIYMNNPSSDVLIYANSFERDMDYTEADHAPVVSEFTYYY